MLSPPLSSRRSILADRVALFKRVGTAALSILLALVLSNSGVLPACRRCTTSWWGPGVLAGIVLVLLSVNLTTVRDAGWPMLAAFALACVASIVGAVIMATILHSSIGEETWKLSGQFTATYIGGGMNFAAVGRELGTRSDLFAAGIAADVIVTAFWLLACLTIPEFLSKRTAKPAVTSAATVQQSGEARPALDILLGSSGRPMTLMDFAGLAAVTFGTMAAADLLTAVWPVLPRVLWITTLALILAQVPLIRKLSGGVVVGNFLMLLFLASNGAKSVVALIVEVGPARVLLRGRYGVDSRHHHLRRRAGAENRPRRAVDRVAVHDWRADDGDGPGRLAAPFGPDSAGRDRRSCSAMRLETMQALVSHMS